MATNISKKLIVSTFLLLLSVLLIACSNGDSSEGGNNDDHNLGMVAAQGSVQHEAAEMFAELVDEKTNGEVVINVFPAGQLGSDESLGQDLSRGNLGFAFINQGSLSGMDPLLDFHYLPFIATNYEQVDELYYGDGIIPQTMRETLADHGIRVLAWYENEFRGLSNSIKPVESPEDLDGLRLRVPGSQAIMNFFQALDAQTVTIAMPELYTSLQQGTVDGQDNGLLITFDNRLHETNNFYTRLNHVYAMSTIAVSEDVWETFTEEQQKAIEEAAKETEEWQIVENRKETEEYVQKMIDEGVEVITPSDEAFAAFQEVGIQLWDELADIYGEDRIEQLKEEVQQVSDLN